MNPSQRPAYEVAGMYAQPQADPPEWPAYAGIGLLCALLLWLAGMLLL